MSLGVNNPVTFCGKNNEVHKALKKLEHEKIISNETIDKLVNELVEVAKRSSKAEQIETALKKSPSIIEKTIVNKLGVEVPKAMELATRSKAKQIEVLMRKAVLDTSFLERIAKILGK